MSRTPRDVTDAELAILESLWAEGESSIRQLTDRLYPEGSVSHYATVQKLLERLEGKKYVDRSRNAIPHQFRAAVAREELIGRRLQATAEKLCGGSLTPLIMHLVRNNRLSSTERRELRELIDELERGNRNAKSKG